MYSLIGTCKLNDINPRAYLEYVLKSHRNSVLRGSPSRQASKNIQRSYLPRPRRS
ncbi:transposase domain-containing protein [Paraburkholderia xenovorans]|uniref:transposase domain-containing protein n=1 Tax=Paraburkholderia xenovorans TaxID=36873 RepID=UPI0038995395